MARTAASNTHKPEAHITQLPMEILSKLPYLLGNLDDLYALLSTSRLFYQACAGSRVKLPIGPATEKRLTLAGTARQLAEWAAESQENKARLRAAIGNGSNSLLRLSATVARLDLDEMRTLHEAKKNIICPLVGKLQGDCGKCGQGSYYKKHCLDFTTALYDFIIYCELFYHDVASILYDDSTRLALGRSMRFHWIHNCLRDVDYHGCRRSVLRNRRLRDLENLFSCPDLAVVEKFCDTMMDLIPNLTLNEEWLRRDHQNLHALCNLMRHRGWITLCMILHNGFCSHEQQRMASNMLATLIETDRVSTRQSDPTFRQTIQWFSIIDDLGTAAMEVR